MRSRYLFYAMALLILLVVNTSAPAGARSDADAGQVFTVTKTEDANDGVCTPADCSLREAVIAANSTAGADAIALPAGVYALTIAGRGEDAAASGDLDLSDNARIVGAGAAATIIDGRQLDRVFHVIRGDVSFEGLTIQNGRSVGSLGGGGIAIGVWGWVRILNSIVSDNTAGSAAVFGCGDETLALPSANSRAPLSAIFVPDNPPPPNCNGGGISNRGDLDIQRSTVRGNLGLIGGGVWNGAGARRLHISQSAFVDNVAVGDGGITTGDAAFLLENSTIAFNTGIHFTGAIGGRGRILHSTITNNSGQFYGAALSGEFELQNSILAHNYTSGSGACSGAILSLGHNIIDDDFTWCDQTWRPTDKLEDPGLSGLIDTTQPGAPHYALLPTSVAIDAGSLSDCPPEDQLGNLRPRDGNNDGIAVCDIGAIEFQPVEAVRRFRGYTYQGQPGDRTHGLDGVRLWLYGRDEGQPAPGSLIESKTSDGSGFFSFYVPQSAAYAVYRLAAETPAAMVGTGAWSEDGTILDSLTVQWVWPGAEVHLNEFYFDLPTATPTTTPTPTTTVTPTSTSTATPAPTLTATPFLTSTITPTSSPTLIPTVTVTATPSLTPAATAPTATLTSTPSATPQPGLQVYFNLITRAYLRPNTFTVTKSEDTADGVCDEEDCSLREAILAANFTLGADEIRLPAGIYTLSLPGSSEDAGASGDLDIKGTTRLLGSGAERTIIDGGQIDRVLHIHATAAVELYDLQLRNGHAPDHVTGQDGGGILNAGQAELYDCLITDNRSGNGGVVGLSPGNRGGNGGGIANRGTMSLVAVVVRANQTGSGGDADDSGCGPDGGAGGSGGGIFTDGDLTAMDSIVTGNLTGNGGDGGHGNTGYPTCGDDRGGKGGEGGAGGGVAGAGTLLLMKSVVSDNRCGDGGDGGPQSGAGGKGGSGGGLSGEGQWRVIDTEIRDNVAGTGGRTASTDWMPGWQVSGGSGGGIFNAGAMRLHRTVIQGNRTDASGGGIANYNEMSAFEVEINHNSTALSDDEDFEATEVQSPDSEVVLPFPGESGKDGGDGGGILNAGMLILDSSRMMANRTASGGNGGDSGGWDYGGQGGNGGDGGAIANEGTAVVTACSIVANSAGSGGDGGGGIAGGHGGRGGHGGGIANSGILALNNSTLLLNIAGDGGKGGGGYRLGDPGAAGSGGGVHSRGNATFLNTSITANRSGHPGPLPDDPPPDMTLTPGMGGGIFYAAGDNPLAWLHISHSSVRLNEAEFGGGVSSSGGANLAHCTLSENLASEKGGGLAVWTDSAPEGHLTVTNCTIAANHAEAGGGIFADSLLAASIRNTLMAQNTALGEGPDCSGWLSSGGANLFASLLGCHVARQSSSPPDLSCDGLAPAVCPGLAPSLERPAPGQDHFPLATTSVAIDAGSNQICGPDDQIGQPRPDDGDGDGEATCDIGAIEYQGQVVDMKKMITK